MHDGVLVTDNGFWDTFRTVYPLLALVAPAELGIICEGWVNAYKEGGWIPKVSSEPRNMQQNVKAPHTRSETPSLWPRVRSPITDQPLCCVF